MGSCGLWRIPATVELPAGVHTIESADVAAPLRVVDLNGDSEVGAGDRGRDRVLRIKAPLGGWRYSIVRRAGSSWMGRTFTR